MKGRLRQLAILDLDTRCLEAIFTLPAGIRKRHGDPIIEALKQEPSRG